MSMDSLKSNRSPTIKSSLNASMQSVAKSEGPQQIDMEIFSKFQIEVERQFHTSIDSVEKCFRDQTYQIKKLFFDKINEFKAFNEMIQDNHLKISEQYEMTQKKLKQRIDKIQAEKDAWEHEKRLIQKKNQFNSDVVALNVGGTHQLMVSQKVLCSAPNSSLEKMFSGMHELKKVDQSVFLDRDGKTFQTLVNYLRNERKIYPEFESQNEQRLFSEELNFWGIKDDRQEEKRLEVKFPAEMIEMLKIEPGEEIDFSSKNDVNDIVRQTWNMLGAFRLIDIVKNSIDEVDFTLPYGKSLDKYRTQLYGQTNSKTGKCEGICRLIFAEPNSHIYEGQCKNDQKRNGYGRQIYVDGNYYIGHWKDDKKNGWGKKVYVKSGKIEEGNWENGEFRG